MRTPVRLLAWLALASGAAACGSDGPPAPLLLISVDGLRHDYLDKAHLPNLEQLVREGVRAPLVPVFPAKTFPNHYTIVTGLYPEEHGIVANTMYDAALDAWFSMSNRAAVQDGRWWGGEPIWITAERAGWRTAPLFWPGSEAEIRGRRPTHWLPFDNDLPNDARIDSVLAWLDVPDGERPVFLTVYVSTVDVAGHDHGLESPELVAALHDLDALLGRLLAALERRQLRETMHILLVSDHGQAATSPDRVIVIDELLPAGLARIVDWSPVLQLRPEPGLEDSVYRVLAGRHPRLQVYRRAEVPAHLHYRAHPRIQPIVAIADEGWSITTRRRLDERPAALVGANHGWDPALPSMWGTFLAVGPAFRRGVRGDPVASIHLYELMCRLLHLTPEPNSGHPDATAWMLAGSGWWRR